MKKRISLSRLMHNDRLMMAVSLILAILVWALVVYGPSNAQDQVITGVPVSVTLNDYASQTLGLRITEGANATATVTVHGLRSVVGKLSAADITVTADTGNVIKEGTYTLPLRAVSTGDYTIRGVVGSDGTSDTVTISCDVWREASFPVTVEMPNLSLLDDQNLQFGTPVLTGDAVTDGQVTVSGPRTDINRIATLVAIIEDTSIVEDTAAYTARLEARDEKGDEISSVAFNNAEDGKVGVTMPVMVYRRVQLTPSVLHAPAGYSDIDSMVKVSPSSIELWGVRSEIDEYIADLQSRMQIDFDQLSADTLSREVLLEPVEGIRPVNENEIIHLSVSLTRITTKTLEIPLSADNVSIINCPSGYRVRVTQNKLTGVTLCGTSRVLGQIKASDIRVVVDMSNTASVGQQTVPARITIQGQNTAWVYYGASAHSKDVLVSVEQTGG